MGIGSAVLETTVAEMLGGPAVAKMAPYTFNGHTIGPKQFSHMAVEIRHSLGKLNVAYKPFSKHSYYESKGNMLNFNFLMPTALEEKAIVIHETTHAILDFFHAKMDIATSEAIGYLMQCQFARANSPSDDPEVRLMDTGEKKDKVFEIGWELAGKLLSGQSVSDGDFSKLKTAVSMHPTYKKVAADMADFDGM